MYALIKRMILTKNFKDKEEFQKRIDVFYLTGKLTDEQYEELTIMLMELEM